VKLRYILPALADVNAVLDYIAAHSPQGARRVQARRPAMAQEAFNNMDYDRVAAEIAATRIKQVRSFLGR
jgi:hypothetical protein